MSKIIKLNEQFANLYQEKDKLEATRIVNSILSLLEDIHLSKCDPMMAQLSRANYTQSFNSYLDNIDSQNNPFLSQVDIIRQIISSSYRNEE